MISTVAAGAKLFSNRVQLVEHDGDHLAKLTTKNVFCICFENPRGHVRRGVSCGQDLVHPALVGPNMGPKRFVGTPERRLMLPKKDPRGANFNLAGFNISTKRHQMAPDGTQMAPRWHPDGTQMAPDGTR